jgi:ribosome-associated translation inhibitor RaiA
VNIAIAIHAPTELSDAEKDEAVHRLTALQHYIGRPINDMRLTLRHPDTRLSRLRWTADATVDVHGRVLAAHAEGPTAMRATRMVTDRLRRQLRSLVGAEVAQRNEPRVTGARRARP